MNTERFNDRLAELGYPTRAYERIVFRALAFRSKVAPAKANLAATAALEHFTAVLAEHILTSEEIRDRLGHPAVRDLFVWHALEESEHKAVAFDVYRAVGGTERMRIWTMKAIRVGFILAATAAVVGSLAGDWATYRPGALRTSWKRFKTSPMISKDMWAALKEYDRPGFHPDDRDTDELLEHWRAELFGENGSLNNLLARRGRMTHGPRRAPRRARGRRRPVGHRRRPLPPGRVPVGQLRHLRGPRRHRGHLGPVSLPGHPFGLDMFTLGYSFRPWDGHKAIADGGDILRYICDTATDEGIDEHIRFQHRIVAADWHTDEGRWHVTAEHTGPARPWR